MAYSLVTVTGSFPGQAGTVTFTPPSGVTDLTGTVPVLGPGAFSYTLSGGAFTSAPLLATDNVGLLPVGWTWLVTIALAGQKAYSYPVLIPASGGATQTLSALPVSAAGGAGTIGDVTSVTAGDASIAATGTAVVTLETGTLDQVANLHPPAADWSNNSHAITAVKDLAVSGLTGATTASRYVGATASGAPATGTFAVGDFIIDQTGTVWICTAAGSPGTWTAPAQTAANALPASAGYVAWTGDRWTSARYAATYTSAYPAGDIALTRMNIPFAVTCTGNVDVMWSAGTGTAGSNGYLGMFDSTGAQIGVSADISGHAAGWISFATGKTLWAAGFYYCAFVIGTQFGTTGCGPVALGGDLATIATAAPGDSQPFRASLKGGSLTAMPSSLTLGSGWTPWFMNMEFLLR